MIPERFDREYVTEKKYPLWVTLLAAVGSWMVVYYLAVLTYHAAVGSWMVVYYLAVLTYHLIWGVP